MDSYYSKGRIDRGTTRERRNSMRDKADRLDAMHKRAEELRRKRDMLVMRALGTASALLFVSLIGVMTLLESAGHSVSAEGLYGTSMLNESTGGYILVAIISFMLAVVITVLCFKIKEYKKDKTTNREQ